ncbi:NADH-quinone oxidoreductase subunit J [bacterium]|nr:NADH-quinone oxidoreductase subunit J [bacterium]
MEAFLFYFCGAVMLLGAIGVVIARSAVMGACSLILSFLGSAGLFAALSAPFLAVLQVLVYAGAIMVLFLFVIMMLEGPVMETETSRPKLWTTLMALVPAVIILAAVAIWLPAGRLPGFTSSVPEDFGQPMPVAAKLLGDYVFAFEIISVVMLVAMVGALALARSKRNQPWT